jgi:hypothetical protein
MALITFRQGIRMRLWVLVLPAVALLVLGDLSAPRFDPVFEAVPAAIGTSLLVMAVLAAILGIFFATYSLPAELESKVAFSVVTKPVSAAEIVAGKVLGMSLLVLAMLALVAIGGYAYIVVRASTIQSLAAERLGEVTHRAAFPADLNAIEAIARRGPLQPYRYFTVSSGPDIFVDRGPDKAAAPGTQWILGETGMRLVWSLEGSPVRQWVSAGGARLRLRVVVEPPPDAPASPTPVFVAVLPRGTELHMNDPSMEDPRSPMGHVRCDLAPSGEAWIPLAPPDAPPTQGVINLPPEAAGDLDIALVAFKAGCVLGAKAGSATLVNASGQSYVIPMAPVAGSAKDRRRVMLAGRSTLPRQVAEFRFDDVPAGDLGEGDTGLEIGFSLDAWAPPSVQAAAEITFTRSDGRQQSLLFSPEARRSTVVYLDRDFWHGGPLDVRLACLTSDDHMGLLPESVRLRMDGGPFLLNYAKSVLRVWLFGTVLAAAGVAASTRVSWFVGILVAAFFLLLAAGRDWLMQFPSFAETLFLLLTVFLVIAMGYFLTRKRLRWGQRLIRVAGVAVLCFLLSWLFALRLTVLHPLPEITWLLPGDTASAGQVISFGEMGLAFALAVVCSTVLVVFGTWLFKGREVAA